MAPGVTSDVAYGAGDGRGISYQMDGVGVGDPDGGTAWVFVDYNIIEEAKVMGHRPAGRIRELHRRHLQHRHQDRRQPALRATSRSTSRAARPAGSKETEGYLKGDVLPSLWGTENNGAYVGDWPEMTSPLEKLLDANAHLGGPIIKDKLWFFAGAQWYNSKDYVDGLSRWPADYKQPRFFIKLNAQAQRQDEPERRLRV